MSTKETVLKQLKIAQDPRRKKWVFGFNFHYSSAAYIFLGWGASFVGSQNFDSIANNFRN